VAKDGTLLAEVERDLLDGKPLADILRKCILLGRRAGSVELRDWASKELRGYEGDDEVPAYRVVGAPIFVDGVTGNAVIKHQHIAASALPDFAQEWIREEVPLRAGVGELEALVKDRKPDEGVYLLVPGAAEIGAYIDAESGNAWQHTQAIYWSVVPSVIHGVIDNIRTTLTELVSELIGTTPEGQEVPTPEQAHQAVQVAVHGWKSQVSVVTAQSAAHSTSAVTPSTSSAGDPEPAWWTLGRKIAAFIVGCAVIIGTVLAYYHR
jgi:hypothetical protein